MTSTTRDDPVRRPFARARQPGTAGPYVERLPLPVAMRGHDEPGGVPLEHILAAAQRISSTVDGIAVSRGEFTVTHREPPADADRQRLRDLLGDRDRLLALAPPAGAAVPDGEALRGRLRDGTTPDAEWIRLFRRWAVTELLPHDGSG
jgi:hypothetical protein